MTFTDGVVVRRGPRGIAQTRQTGLAPGGLAYAQRDVGASPSLRVLLGTTTLARWTAVVASSGRLWALDEISDAVVLVNPDLASPVRRDEIGCLPVALAANAFDAFVYDLEELCLLRFTRAGRRAPAHEMPHPVPGTGCWVSCGWMPSRRASIRTGPRWRRRVCNRLIACFVTTGARHRW